MNDPLLETVLKNPNDMTARLVYADWLEENNRMPEAVAWRWMAKVKWNPHTPQGAYCGPRKYSVWRDGCDIGPHGPEHGDIPPKAFKRVVGLRDDYQIDGRFAKTYKDAVGAAVKALADAYQEGSWEGRI